MRKKADEVRRQTSFRLTGEESSRLDVSFGRDRFLIRNCWNIDWFLRTLPTVKPEVKKCTDVHTIEQKNMNFSVNFKVHYTNIQCFYCTINIGSLSKYE